jgi:cytochrome b subunit of formate dehydrogenase
MVDCCPRPITLILTGENLIFLKFLTYIIYTLAVALGENNKILFSYIVRFLKKSPVLLGCLGICKVLLVAFVNSAKALNYQHTT